MFEAYLRDWDLEPDGAPIVTPTSCLLPVRQRGQPAMLKRALHAEEQRGNRLMIWWGGEGAARVLAHDGDVVLMERAAGGKLLAALARAGRDATATRIMTEVIARLHAPRPQPPPALVPLDQWFADLSRAAAGQGGVLRTAAAVAGDLLATPREITPLHGDIHHGNILDFGSRGWLAVDPKGLLGERAFEYANLFCNPDRETAKRELSQRLTVVSAAAGLEPRRLLQWVLAWSGLSAAFALADGHAAADALDIVAQAAVELGLTPGA